MTDRQEFNRLVRRTAFLTVALVAALAFGIVLLAAGDWIPGGITVAAALVGLGPQAAVITRLCSAGPAPAPPTGDQTRHSGRRHPPTPRP